VWSRNASTKTIRFIWLWPWKASGNLALELEIVKCHLKKYSIEWNMEGLQFCFVTSICKNDDLTIHKIGTNHMFEPTLRKWRRSNRPTWKESKTESFKVLDTVNHSILLSGLSTVQYDFSRLKVSFLPWMETIFYIVLFPFNVLFCSAGVVLGMVIILSWIVLGW
jgi:hypothetical protein